MTVLVDMEEQNKSTSETLDSSTEVESLDSQTTVVTEDTTPGGTSNPNASGDKKPSKKKRYRGKGIAARFNVWLLLFIFIIVIAGLIAFISYQQNKKSANQTTNISTTPLSQQDLDKLRQTDVKVGDPKQILSVESNAVFAGKVLIRDSLEVAGQIKIGGPLNLPGLTVSGDTAFNKISATNLQVSGATTIQGALNVQNNLGVSGNLSVGGSITAPRINVETLSLNNDIQLSRHIDAGGATPSSSSGNALGGGGTSSVSGTDTAGTVNINTGSGPAAGCFISVSFTQKFASPHIAITPIGSGAAGLNYYVTRSSTGFSICTTNSAPAGQSFGFDYIVID